MWMYDSIYCNWAYWYANDKSGTLRNEIQILKHIYYALIYVMTGDDNGM